MPLLCAGINHRTAPVPLRELLWLGSQARSRLAHAGLAELAVLATCNRTEVYAVAEELSSLESLLASVAGLPVEALARHVYGHAGVAAVRHLCDVAAGLDSMVLGESEILGQVTAAYETAQREGTGGPLLEAAFRSATRAGRRARAETGIGRHPVSVSTEAVRVLAQAMGGLDECSVLIVGTGKMGRLAGAALRAHGVRRLAVISRTSRHADAIAGEWGATALPWHDLASAIGAADAVFCSTAAPHAVVTRELVERAIGPAGDGRPRVFLDIAVPRDIEPAVGRIPGVTVFDLDALQDRLEGNLDLRRREVPAVQRIVEQEVAAFEEWRRGAALRPLLVRMRAHSESIRRHELDRMLRRLGPTPPKQRAQLEAFSQSLVNKLLHEPTRRLREATDPAVAQHYAEVTSVLFGLEDEDASTAGTAA